MNKNQIKALDELWCNLIRCMYGFVCAVCRKEGHDAHHIIPRFDKRHRWHPLNGVLLCTECHAKAHAKPKLFKKWLKRNLPAVYEHISKPNDGGLDPKDYEGIKKLLKATHAVLLDGVEKMAHPNPLRKGHASLTFLPLVVLIVLVIYFAGVVFLPNPNLLP